MKQSNINNFMKPISSLCYFCSLPFEKYEVPDCHHVNGNNKDKRPENEVEVHHICHLKHHGTLPKNYDELRGLVEVKKVYQKERIAFNNQIIALKKLNLTVNKNHEQVIKLIKKIEGDITKEYSKIIRNLPIWKYWLSDITGIAEDLCGQLIGRINNISKFEKVSSLWSYCGLAPNQGLKKGENHSYNHELKNLMFVIGDRLVRYKHRNKYGKLYDEVKKELKLKYPVQVKNCKENGFKKNYTDMHIHRMALRRIEKEFLKDLWINWRKIEKISKEKEENGIEETSRRRKANEGFME